MTRRHGGLYGRHLKRCCDFVIAFGALAVLSPLLGGVALAVRIWMGRPVLFRQVRIGLDERPFTALKFRTMRDLRDADGQLLPDAVRLPRLGRMLRSTSLDELPQLWIVLKGEMSLVGPRPLYARYLAHYSTRERLRHRVRPGITGLAQVSGRNLIDWDQRLELDARYAEQVALRLDAAIVLRTVMLVLRRDGVQLQALPDLDEQRRLAERPPQDSCTPQLRRGSP